MKGQVAIEFMIILGVFLVALTLVVMAVWNNTVNIDKSTIDFDRCVGLQLQPGRTGHSGEKGSQDQVERKVYLQVEGNEYDQRHESTQSHHMYADPEPDGDEKCDQQADQSTKHKGIKHAGDVNAPDQVEAKYKQEKSNDDGYVPVLPSPGYRKCPE